MNIKEIRDKYPQYSDMSDGELVNGLHQKYYSDMPILDFAKKVGLEAPTDNVKPPTFAGEVVDRSKKVGEGIAEAGAGFVGAMVGMPAAGVAGIAELVRTGGDVNSAVGAVRDVAEATAYPAQTDIGKSIEAGITYPFKKLSEFGGAAGNKVLDVTGSPELATVAHTAIEALPVWAGVGAKAVIPRARIVFDRIKNSQVRRAAMKEFRGLPPEQQAPAIITLEEALSNNPSMTEAEIVRRWPQFREEAISKRNVGEQAKTVNQAAPVKQAEQAVVQPEQSGQVSVAPENTLPDVERGFSMRNPSDVYSKYSPELAAAAGAGMKRLPSDKVAGDGFVMNPPVVQPQPTTILRKSEENKALQPPKTEDNAPATLGPAAKVIFSKVHPTERKAINALDKRIASGKIGDGDYDVVEVQGGWQIQTVTPEERAARNKIPAEMRDAVSVMKSEVMGGKKGERTFVQENGQDKITGEKSTYPEWFRADKKKADKNGLLLKPNQWEGNWSRDEFNGLLGKLEKGRSLTPKEQDRADELMRVAEYYSKTNKDLADGKAFDALVASGFEPVVQTIPAGEINPGDQVVFSDSIDIFTAKDDGKGGIRFEDGIERVVDPFDAVNIDAIKRVESKPRVKFEKQKPIAARNLERIQREAAAKGEVVDFTKEENANLVIATKTDETSGFTSAQSGTARHESARRAQEHIKNYPQDSAFYIEIDIRNLTKLNKELGNSTANKVYRQFSDIVAKHLDGVGAEADKFRHGGDELSAVVVGDTTKTELTEAMFSAMKEIQDLSKTIKGESGFISDVEHHKHLGDPLHHGTGINFAIEPFTDTIDIKETIKTADKLLESRKELKDGEDHEYKSKVAEIRGVRDRINAGNAKEIPGGREAVRGESGSSGEVAAKQAGPESQIATEDIQGENIQGGGGRDKISPAAGKRDFSPEVRNEPLPGRRVSPSEVIDKADDLVASENLEQINKKLDDIFGITEKQAEEFDYTSKIPASIQLNYDLANDYRADIEYAARVRDKAEVRALLKAVSKDRRDPGTRREAAEVGNIQPSTKVPPPEVKSPKTESEISNDKWIEENRDNIDSSIKVNTTVNGKEVAISAKVALKKIEAKIDRYEKIAGCL